MLRFTPAGVRERTREIGSLRAISQASAAEAPEVAKRVRRRTLLNLPRRRTVMMNWSGAGMSGVWVFMSLFWLVVFGLFVWAIVRILPGRSGGSGHGVSRARAESPEEILDRRFACGDIDLEVYRAGQAALLAARGKR